MIPMGQELPLPDGHQRGGESILIDSIILSCYCIEKVITQQTCKKLSFSFHLGDASDVYWETDSGLHAMVECAGRKVF